MNESDRALAAAIFQVAREAEAELTGNVYYMVTQKLTELREIVLSGVSDPSAGRAPGDMKLIGLAPAMTSLKSKMETGLQDNRYYLAAHKLDVMTFIARRAPSPIRPSRQPVEQPIGSGAQTRTADAA